MSVTIEDIVREMREGFNVSWHDVDREWAHDLADRIEAAANGLRTENARLKDEIKCKTQNYEDVIRAKGQELERLRAALKPVIEVEWHKHKVWAGPDGWNEYGDPLPSQAVKESQRIYKEVGNEER